MALYMHKQQIMHKLKFEFLNEFRNEDLVKISVSTHPKNNELAWEHEREFEYRGEMYDVVRTVYDKDSIHYYCFNDKAECTLNSQLQEALNLMGIKDKKPKEHQGKLLEFYKNLYCTNSISFADTHPTAHDIIISTTYGYQSVYCANLPTPPPELRHF
jgi:hypothetical protein